MYRPAFPNYESITVFPCQCPYRNGVAVAWCITAALFGGLLLRAFV